MHPRTSKGKRLTAPKLGRDGRDHDKCMNQQRLYPHAFPRKLVSNKFHKVVEGILEPTAQQLSRAADPNDRNIEIDEDGLIEFFIPVAGHDNNYPVPPAALCIEDLPDNDIRMMFPRVPGKEITLKWVQEKCQ